MFPLIRTERNTIMKHKKLELVSIGAGIGDFLRGSLEEIVKEDVGWFLEDLMKSSKWSYFYAPVEWDKFNSNGANDEFVENPLDMYLSLNGEYAEGFVIRMNLDDIIAESLESGGSLERMVEPLRKLADKIESYNSYSG